MEVIFTQSADKHGVSHGEAIYAIAHAAGTELCDDGAYAFIGHPHQGALADDWLEVLARKTSRGDVVIFHVMPLTDRYVYLLPRR